MRKMLFITASTLTALALTQASAQDFSVGARFGSEYGGAGLEAQLGLNRNLSAHIGVGQDRIAGGLSYFLPNAHYLRASVNGGNNVPAGVTTMIGHRFNSSNYYIDVEGGLNWRNGVSPTVGAGFGFRF
ncbi:hypothetical protein HNR42_001473 [Deinobacterium chartae]|uniref:Outer membrane protein beta-barrel domain-containing protein n=1 Tax=Deinobacterium chartae TaxID=521158 RepID=A0A841I0T6_9DEIO|nr:hypothetical protein [Deinobacterium chartae]MBB6098050.1 hypothetical protein [Deinobacterium chartae]